MKILREETNDHLATVETTTTSIPFRFQRRNSRDVRSHRATTQFRCVQVHLPLKSCDSFHPIETALDVH